MVRAALRRGVLPVAAATALVPLAALALTAGPFPAAWPELAAALSDPGGPPGSVGFILWELRVPRLVAGAAAGAALAAAAVLLQGLWRTPVMDPVLSGMAGGAVLGAVLAGPVGQAGPGARAIAAVAGAMAGFALVQALLSRGPEPVGVLRRAGTGAAVDAVLTGCAVAVVALAAHDADAAFMALAWTAVGGLSGALRQAWPLGLLCAAVVCAAVAAAGRGRSGEGTGPVALRTPAAAAALTGCAVALAGPLVLAGLPAAVAARVLMAGHPRWSVVLAAPLGAFTVLAADTALRAVSAPVEPPAGFATAGLGLAVLVGVWAVGERRGGRTGSSRSAGDRQD